MITKKLRLKVIGGLAFALILLLAWIGVSSIRWSSIWKPGEDPVLGNITVSQDEMKVVLLGTGSPVENPLRSKPAQAVLAGGKIFRVDCGASTATQLTRAGIEPKNVDAVFSTHFHSDHDVGFPDFYLTSWIVGTKERDT